MLRGALPTGSRPSLRQISKRCRISASSASRPIACRKTVAYSKQDRSRTTRMKGGPATAVCPVSSMTTGVRRPSGSAAGRYADPQCVRGAIEHLIEREPDDILFLGLRVRLRRVFGEAIGGDEAPVLRFQPPAPMRRSGVADVGDRRAAVRGGGGMPQRIMISSRSLPTLRITGAG